ncbi:MAG: FKBP-type peptidyl-prolyl cis-trans isomerase [Bacteroidia bacterium]|jgi:FKBP-type peptidyl-prolyl cis-trans isomerase FkpA|tara:strand:- start:42687 stop:43142 length:456 start_codon:yes stop_codon:yes gene_type:complete
MKQLIYLFLFLNVALVGCKEEDFTMQNDDEIKQYLAANNITAEKTEEGLYYIITQEGTGVNPNIANEVTVHYKGYLLNGDIFDSSYDRGERSTFSLGGVIKGWQIGIPQLKEGGAGRLFIPSHLAYGANPPNRRIPANAVLAFDIELFEVR